MWPTDCPVPQKPLALSLDCANWPGAKVGHCCEYRRTIHLRNLDLPKPKLGLH